MSTYHPAIDILLQKTKISVQDLEPFQEQMLLCSNEPMAIKELFLKNDLLDEASLQQAFSEYYELEYRDNFDAVEFNSEFMEMIPIRYAKKFVFFPLSHHSHQIEVAIEDPCNTQPLDDLARRFKCRVQPVLSSRQAILDLINRAYDHSTSTENAVEGLDTDDSFENILALEEPEDLLEATDEEPVKRLVHSILWQAAKAVASDVHIDPSPGETRTRYRIDGILHQMLMIPKQAHTTVVNRIKVMARLDIAQKGMPQDGRTMVLIAGKKIDIRVSTIPTVHGEKIVMRLLYQSERLMNLEELGLAPHILSFFNKMIHRSGGIILVTGPTGSGKTTTLYATLGEIDHEARNVITIEEPVEYKIPGYSQIEVKPKAGLTFAKALRSVLRQDPDVIMIGEMRDTETAKIAIQSALTGHLVFSTVHTNSAAATITRLIDMGIEPFLVSSTIIGVLAQRLVRQVCSNCIESYTPAAEELDELGVSQQQFEQSNKKLYKGKGCDQCHQTGYRGRVGIHELLIMDESLKNRITHTSDTNEIKRYAMQQGMHTLRMDGINKVLQGITTVKEVVAISSDDETLAESEFSA